MPANETVTLESLAFGGEAVGRIGGKVVFVPGGVPGDVVRIAVTEEKPGYSRGNITEIITPSPERIDPFCPYADRCGGCQWQQISYKSQLEWKQRIVAESIRRIGGLERVTVEDCIESPANCGYRSVARYPAVKTTNGLMFGYYQPNSHTIVDIKECPIASIRVNDAAALIRKTVNDCLPNIPDLKELTIRASHNHPSTLVSFMSAGSYDFTAIAETMMAGIEGLAGVSVWQAAGGEKPRHVRTFGERWRFEHICERRFRIDERSFFQVHAVQAERLVSLIQEMTVISPDSVVVDAFGGVGLLSMGAFTQETPIRLFDTSRSAIRDSIENARENGFTNFTAKVSDARAAFAALKRADMLIIDPPRTGLGKRVVENACSLGAKEIIYVSCNPATLARDLAVFVKNGYGIERVVPVDMFPQTYHIETIVKLVKPA